MDEFRQAPDDGLWKLGSISLTAAEYGFAETINQIIKEITELSERKQSWS